MKNKVLNYIRENKMLEAKESVVIGVSGGADSMCLLHIMEELGRLMDLKLAVVHIHHGIRKETADRDAAHVESYCREHGIDCYVKRYDVPALSKEWGMSEEEAGRKVRYDAFNEVLCAIGDGHGKIAVAHNADDSAETVLLNLFRGSGIKGMTGILPVRGNIIRPVLCLTRQEIERYNELNGIAYIHDETNFEPEYTRNKLRLQILPAIKDGINARAAEHINAAGQSLFEIDDYMEQECEKIFETVAKVRKNKNIDADDTKEPVVYIQSESFLALHSAMQLQLVKKCLYMVAGRAKDITAKHMKAVQGLFFMEVGKSISLPYDMVAVKEYEGVAIKKNHRVEKATQASGNASQEIIIDREGSYLFDTDEGQIELSVERDVYNERIFIENQYTKWIDYDIMESNLLIRTRRDGDYIIVDEKGSRKKLKDFFIDKKIPRQERDKICLVAKGSEIIWIVGHRLSAAYRVSKNTRNILKLHVESRR